MVKLINRHKHWKCVLSTFLYFTAAAGAPVLPQKRVDRQINEDVRRMMTSLFNVLEPELNNFILSFEKLDSLYVACATASTNQMISK